MEKGNAPAPVSAPLEHEKYSPPSQAELEPDADVDAKVEVRSRGRNAESEDDVPEPPPNDHKIGQNAVNSDGGENNQTAGNITFDGPTVRVRTESYIYF